MRIAALIAALCAVLLAQRAAASETVEIAAGGTILHAVLYRPAGPGPFPAVVGLHGCDGLFNKSAEPGTRYHDWGEHLAAAGFVVLFVDSFGSRGLGSQCSVREPKRTSRVRVADANAARRWLQAQNFVKGDRIALLGWSNGATATLWAVRPRAAPRDGAPDFRSAVAFYPGCRLLNELAWSARIPTLVLIGAADDWTPASVCQRMVAGARGRSALAEIVAYPRAHHDFDHPNRPLSLRTGLAVSADGSGRAHVATDATARADALRRVPEWFSR